MTDPLAKGPDRTPESYQEHVQAQRHNAESSASSGVRFFNELAHFRVCQPGLPPCLGHDLFEDIVSSDLTLYINHLVTKEKRFSYLELNRHINQFKYLGNDTNNKPCEVNPRTGKLSGHAVQK